MTEFENQALVWSNQMTRLLEHLAATRLYDTPGQRERERIVLGLLRALADEMGHYKSLPRPRGNQG